AEGDASQPAQAARPGAEWRHACRKAQAQPLISVGLDERAAAQLSPGLLRLGPRTGCPGCRPAFESRHELGVRHVDRRAADARIPAPEHELVVEVLTQAGQVAPAVLRLVLQTAAQLA